MLKFKITRQQRYTQSKVYTKNRTKNYNHQVGAWTIQEAPWYKRKENQKLKANKQIDRWGKIDECISRKLQIWVKCKSCLFVKNININYRTQEGPYLIIKQVTVISSHQELYRKKVFLKISQTSQENTCVGISF